MRKFGLVGAILTAGVVSTAFAGASAHAGGNKLTFAGLGSAAPSSGAHVILSGEGSGTPLSGSYAGGLTALDGSWPSVGVCEPAQLQLRVVDSRERSIEVAADGTVCTVLLPLGVMQDFNGRFTVSSTSAQRLRRVEGTAQVRLLEGQSDVYLAG